MSTLRQDIVDLRRSIARNHAALPALTRLLDFNEKAITMKRDTAPTASLTKYSFASSGTPMF